MEGVGDEVISPAPGFEDLPEHLRPMISDRGFKHMPALGLNFGGRLSLYESSAASEPRIWLNATMQKNPGVIGTETISVTNTMDLDDVDRMIDQLMWLRDNHYQRPEGDRTPTRPNEPGWWQQ